MEALKGKMLSEMDDENPSASILEKVSISEPIWWVPPLPMLVHYGQNPAETVLWPHLESVAAEESLPTKSLPIEKTACKIKITDKGKALLLEMTNSLPTEKPACKNAVELKRFSETVVDPRMAYNEKFGKVAWAKAVDLAGRHRKRARDEYGLTEHFTAMEWLDLCARFGMKCPWCLEEGQLSPHHRQALHRHGTNTIDNIWPLCKDCHLAVHEYGIGCEGAWAWRGSSRYQEHEHLDFDPKAIRVDLIDPYRVQIIPRPERTGNCISYSVEISRFFLCPTCLIENEGRLEWWADRIPYRR